VTLSADYRTNYGIHQADNISLAIFSSLVNILLFSQQNEIAYSTQQNSCAFIALQADL
jgi:hypothetical protein